VQLADKCTRLENMYQTTNMQAQSQSKQLQKLVAKEQELNSRNGEL